MEDKLRLPISHRCWAMASVEWRVLSNVNVSTVRGCHFSETGGYCHYSR